MDTSPDEVELQQQLQRFTTQFVDRVSQASEALEASTRPDVRAEALRKNLLYVSAALEIATGPVPQVNLLDMMVFVRLSRTVLESHWIPELYGAQARELAAAFQRFEHELSGIAAAALSPDQREQLARALDGWLRENPDQRRVEGIRLADFAAAAAEPGRQLQGLLSAMRTATRTANQAVLLGERGLFLVHRLPTVWRLQARLGVREMLGDALTELLTGDRSPLGMLRRMASRSVVRLGTLGDGLLALPRGALQRLVKRARELSPGLTRRRGVAS